jgi:hypothetical protein
MRGEEESNPCFNPAVVVTTGAGDPPRSFAVTGR